MIVKIKLGSDVFGINLYENNFDGEVEVIEKTSNIDLIEIGEDDVFGTVDKQCTIDLDKLLMNLNGDINRLSYLNEEKDKKIMDLFNKNAELKKKIREMESDG